MTGGSLYLSLCLSTTTSSKPLQHNDYQLYYGGFTFINFFESQEKTCHVFLPSLPLNNRLWPMSQIYWIRCIFCTCKLILHRVVLGLSVLVQYSPRRICFHHEHLESLKRKLLDFKFFWRFFTSHSRAFFRYLFLSCLLGGSHWPTINHMPHQMSQAGESERWGTHKANKERQKTIHIQHGHLWAIYNHQLI